jgi:serine/threonine protein phosphatase PrpC
MVFGFGSKKKDKEKDAGGESSSSKPNTGRNRRLSIFGSKKKDGPVDDMFDQMTISPPQLQNKCFEAAGGLRVAAISQAGCEPGGEKKENQDSFICITDLTGDGLGGCVLGALDGHGQVGHHVSQFCRDQFPRSFKVSQLSADHEVCKATMTQCFKDVADKLDAQRRIDCSMSGSTAVISLLRNGAVYTANCGDSRCVLGTMKGGKMVAVDLSHDQKPEREDEYKRLLKAGARIEALYDEVANEPIGPLRVWLKDMMLPGVAMSRSFGDAVAATVGVIDVPEVLQHNLTSDDCLIIWASDGVGEFLESQAALDLILNCATPDECCRVLVKKSTELWHKEEELRDDITAVVCFLPGYKK